METGQERILYPEAQFLASQYLRWSPDGRSILCGRSLELIDVQTGDVTRLVQFDPAVSGRVDYAAWSPDGKVIYYIRTSPVVHDLRSLVAHNLETGKERDLWQKGVKLAGLGISPDGRQLVFAKGSKTLMVIAVEGGESRILHRLQGEGYFFQSSITWTADGRYVLFGKNKPRGLWRIPAEGGEPQKVRTTSCRNPKQANEFSNNRGRNNSHRSAPFALPQMKQSDNYSLMKSHALNIPATQSPE
jgi:Tol biopolymer transport system component